MVDYKKPSVDDILKKYGAEIESKINNGQQSDSSPISSKKYSQEYLQFKKELSPELTRYEKWCKSLGRIIKIKASSKDEKKIKRQLEIAHLDIQPSEALGLAVVSFLSVFFLGLLLSVSVALIKGSFVDFPFVFFLLVTFVSVFLFYFANHYAFRLANEWRLKASSQMVPAILYIVVYMRHTSNLEKAVAFASEHLDYPLALDFKKIFYDVEIGKFSTIKESLDNYLETWRDYSVEFIESFQLIEGSLFEPDNDQRIRVLEKALQVVLDGVYEKMLKFTRDVRSPLTNVYMLGVVLPTLALALLPLASAMMAGLLNIYYVFILFNLLVPFFVFYLTDKIMMLRPGGYGETNLLERNPYYPEYKSKKPYFKAFFICLPFFILGFLPLIFHYTAVPQLLGLQSDYSFKELGMGFFGDAMFFDFTDSGAGPFGAGALILSLFIPLGIGLFFSISYKDRTQRLIKERNKTKQLEKEFNNSLFQLGNRIGNGTPVELAFGSVANSSRNLMTADFFKRVNYNIRQMGMGVEKAIFDPRQGAINYYPSNLISTSMKILVESAKKGLRIAAVSLMNISQYIKNLQKVSSRLKDLLAEVVSDMKSNMTFLAPLLSGIVVGLATMIAAILNKLELAKIAGSQNLGMGNLKDILHLFNVSNMIPPYYLQISIGLYLIEIIFILTTTLVTINSGEDKLERTNQLGKNLKKGIFLYFLTAFFATLVLFILTAVVLGNIV